MVRTEYIRQQVPSLPPEPDYYPVEFGVETGKYYTDAEGARNLLKNHELTRGYMDEMKSILTNLKGSEPGKGGAE